MNQTYISGNHSIYRLFGRAIRQDNVDAVKFLARNTTGIDISRNNYKIFVDACGHGKLETAKFLHEHFGIEFLKCEREVLNKVCRYGHIDVLKWLHGLHKIYYSAYRHNHDLCFRMACMYGNIDIAKFLVENIRGIDVFARDDQAFIAACGNGDFDTVKWLHEVGGNRTRTSIESSFGATCIYGNIDIIKWFHESKILDGIEGLKDRELRRAYYHGNIEVFKQLYSMMEKKVAIIEDVDDSDNKSFSCFHNFATLVANNPVNALTVACVIMLTAIIASSYNPGLLHIAKNVAAFVTYMLFMIYIYQLYIKKNNIRKRIVENISNADIINCGIIDYIVEDYGNLFYHCLPTRHNNQLIIVWLSSKIEEGDVEDREKYDQFKRIVNHILSVNPIFRIDTFDIVTDNTSCGICYMEGSDDNPCRRLPCHRSHVYHTDCIGHIIRSNELDNICPTCRQPF